MINLKVAMICFKVSVPFRYLTKKLMGNVDPNIWPLSGLRNDAVRARIFNSERCEAPRMYPYFDVVVGIVWSHDPKSYAGCSLCYW
jgi:hypothetical protein